MTPLLWIILPGLAVTAAALSLFAGVRALAGEPQSPVRARLAMLKTGRSASDADAGSLLTRTLATLQRLCAQIARILYGGNATYQQAVKSLLSEAGLPDSDAHVWAFLARRVLGGVIGGALLGTLSLIFQNGLYLLMGLIAGALVGMLLPQMRLRARAEERKANIRYGLSDTLDLMVVCVEAGLGLDATIQRVAEETARIAPEVSREFRRLNQELSAGIPRAEAFRAMSARAGVDELRSLCAMIIQSDKLGTSIAAALRVHADDLRIRRRQKAEELAAKASIKMTFPLVFFIFPPLFIILLGPVVISTIAFFAQPR